MMENELREPAVAYGKYKYTIEEYLQREEASDEKHGYYQGEIFAMSGAKVPHNIISVKPYQIAWKKAGREIMRAF